MTLFSSTISDAEIIAYVDAWAALLEAGDYQAAYDATAHSAEMHWTAQLIQAVIEQYGEAEPSQRVTVVGTATDVYQRKEVDRWPANRNGSVGEVWYDLNINGMVSDLTATFALKHETSGIRIYLNDIHVM
jgi:hypothetical protein